MRKVRYCEDEKTIVDNKNTVVAKITGWLQFVKKTNTLVEAAILQDEQGKFIADAINEKIAKK